MRMGITERMKLVSHFFFSVLHVPFPLPGSCQVRWFFAFRFTGTMYLWMPIDIVPWELKQVHVHAALVAQFHAIVNIFLAFFPMQDTWLFVVSDDSLNAFTPTLSVQPRDYILHDTTVVIFTLIMVELWLLTILCGWISSQCGLVSSHCGCGLRHGWGLCRCHL